MFDFSHGNRFMGIAPGDRVTITLPHGGTKTGKAVMVFTDHATLNLGGRYGTPGVATEANTIKVTKARRNANG